MANNARLGLGVVVKRGDGGGPEVFTAVAELIDIGDVGEERALVNATHHASTIMEYILGIRDGVEFDAMFHFIPSNATQSAAAGVIGDVQTGIRRNYKIDFPTSPVYTATTELLARAYKIKPPIDDRMIMTVTYKVTGTLTWA